MAGLTPYRDPRGHDTRGDWHCYAGARCVAGRGCHRSESDATYCNRRTYADIRDRLAR
jgi:hypothetical protein